MPTRDNITFSTCLHLCLEVWNGLHHRRPHLKTCWWVTASTTKILSVRESGHLFVPPPLKTDFKILPSASSPSSSSSTATLFEVSRHMALDWQGNRPPTPRCGSVLRDVSANLLRKQLLVETVLTFKLEGYWLLLMVMSCSICDTDSKLSNEMLDSCLLLLALSGSFTWASGTHKHCGRFLLTVTLTHEFTHSLAGTRGQQQRGNGASS